MHYLGFGGLEMKLTPAVHRCRNVHIYPVCALYWSLSLVAQSRDVYILLSRFVLIPHLFNYTRPQILKGYEPHAVPLIICVILCLSAPVCSLGREPSVSFCALCIFLRLFEILIGTKSSRHTRHHLNIIPPASQIHSHHIRTISNSLHHISHRN